MGKIKIKRAGKITAMDPVTRMMTPEEIEMEKRNREKVGKLLRRIEADSREQIENTIESGLKKIQPKGERRIWPKEYFEGPAHPPRFERNVAPVLGECGAVFAQRGVQYGDTWENNRWLALRAVARELGIEMSLEQARALGSAAMVDVKYSRLEGGFKEDTLVDGINYTANLVGEMRTVAVDHRDTGSTEREEKQVPNEGEREKPSRPILWAKESTGGGI